MNTETEILAEVEALKGRFSETRALYREVCALLFFRYGITPTANKLYQYVRKGTMSTPAEALAKFWDELRSKARVKIDHPDLPEELKVTAAETIAALWQQATATARGELQAIRVELQASQDQARQEVIRAQDHAAQAQASIESLRAELGAAHETTERIRTELEAERRAHASSVGRAQELQAQLEQARAQQQHLQAGFSADLASAREAVDAADTRAAATERRALMEIEQERQARAKADRQVEVLRSQITLNESKERQQTLEHAEAVARLQALVESLQGAERVRQKALTDLEATLVTVQAELVGSRNETTRAQAEARTLQGVVDRLTSKEVRGAKRKPTP